MVIKKMQRRPIRATNDIIETIMPFFKAIKREQPYAISGLKSH
jgi:hypothetical protein